MAEIRPFAGVMYNQLAIPSLQDVLAPPYDVISPELQEALYERSGYNVVRLILGKQFPDDTKTDNRYTRGAKYLANWLGDGALTHVDTPSIYLYAQEYEIHGERLKRVGFICGVKLEEFGGSIFRHERTLSGPKIDRLNLTRACRMNFSQVFGLYADPDLSLDSMWEDVMRTDPDAEAPDDDGVVHQMWIVSDEETIATAQSLIGTCPVVIADGHHRYETALNYRNERRAQAAPGADGDRNYDYVMMFLSNIHSHGFTVLATHRVVRKLAGVDMSGLPESLEPDFDVVGRKVDSLTVSGFMRELEKSGEKSQSFGLYTGGGNMLLLSLKQGNEAGGKADLVSRLDVTILQELILTKALGVSREAVADKEVVGYTVDPKAALDMVDDGDAKMAFLLNSVDVKQVMEVATAGGVMPQKSTYFYPKLISGLVFNPL